jgi:hypothetical protein
MTSLLSKPRNDQKPEEKSKPQYENFQTSPLKCDEKAIFWKTVNEEGTMNAVVKIRKDYSLEGIIGFKEYSVEGDNSYRIRILSVDSLKEAQKIFSEMKGTIETVFGIITPKDQEKEDYLNNLIKNLEKS